MMTEFAIPSALASGTEEKVRFVGSQLREELLRSYEAEGWIPVCVRVPGAQGRGRLGLLLEEAIERSLENRGACPPGIGASADSDASLSDQLYRARLLGAPGFALALDSLGSIANRAGALDAEDSAVLRWWVMTARERPLKLFFDTNDRTLGVYTAPTHFWQLVRDSADDEHRSAAPPVNEELASNLVSMQAATEYVARVRACSLEPSATDEQPEQTEAEQVEAVEATSTRETRTANEEPDYRISGSHPIVVSPALERNQPEPEIPPENEPADAADEVESEPTDCSVVVTEAAEEPATTTNTRQSPIERALAAAAQARRQAAPSTSEVSHAAAQSGTLHPEASERWPEWVRQLDEARGPKPLALVEQLFVNAYVPLADAASRGLTGPKAFEVLETWSASFARSYGEAFDALRLRGKRPMMVLDVVDVSIRLARLHGARNVQLILVDGMRFDLGLRIEERMRALLSQQAAMTERLVLWSALPSTTSTQLDLIARGPEGLKKFEPPVDNNDFVAHGRAASTLRRVRAGNREVLKLDLVESRLSEAGIGTPERLDELADDAARALAASLQKLAPRTLAMVFGDHGFAIDPKAAASSKARHGGASPEEILVPAFAWLVGATH